MTSSWSGLVASESVHLHNKLGQPDEQWLFFYMMTSQNVDLQELQILLKGGGIQTHFSDKYLKYLSIFCEIPIRWIQHLTGH